jgi:hypothetical protein
MQDDGMLGLEDVAEVTIWEGMGATSLGYKR